MSSLLQPSRTLGTTGLTISPLALGGNVFGWTADRDQSFLLMDAYAGAGGNFIDTADVYSEWVPGNIGGDSERIMGEWLTARGNRDQMIIATKVGKFSQFRGQAPDNIRAACDASLERLKTDYIDVYYAHEDDPSVPLFESLAAYDGLIKAGKVRAIGVSNFSPERIREALAVSKENGLASFQVMQDEYNLVERTRYEAELEPIVLESGMASMPYYSLARGFLTGKYKAGVKIDSPRAKGAEAYIGEKGDRVLALVEQIAAAHNVHMASVALGWLLTRPGIAAPLASARTLEQFEDIDELAAFTFTDDELAALNTAA